MGNNSVIIATNAGFLADILRDRLRDASFRVYVASTDNELTEKINFVYPRFIFIEHCFHGYGTDDFIKKIVRENRYLRVTVWSACEIKPLIAARFIIAGAESFFSLRDTYKNIENILEHIAGGRHYCPADVEAVLQSERAVPVIGEKLTRREKQVLKRWISGETNKEIGKFLGLSIHTVKMHKCNVYRKCGGDTAIDILRNGFNRGVICPDDFYQ
jgi:DNA-binding NarL/FixJ family response regulator